MAHKRGDVVLIPFPYTDLSATKTRPALIVSSAAYNSHRSDVLLAYVSSQVNKADAVLDYLLQDWSSAALPKPSFVRPKIAAIEASLIVRVIGQISIRDMNEVESRLRIAFGLTTAAI